MTAKPVPDGYSTVTPMLIAERSAELVDFIAAIFDADMPFRLDNPDGTLE